MSVDAIQGIIQWTHPIPLPHLRERIWYQLMFHFLPEVCSMCTKITLRNSSHRGLGVTYLLSGGKRHSCNGRL